MSLRGVLIVVGLAVALALLVETMLPVADAPLQADTGLLDARVRARETRLGKPLSPEDLQRVRDRFRDEELLLAYARQAGLDRIPYVERRLMKKMRFLLSARVPTPSDGELKALYDADPRRFVPPGADAPLTFERVKAQMRAMVAGPMARAAIEARVRELTRRYRLVIRD